MSTAEDDCDCPDALLVTQVLAGERQAFGPLALRHYASLTRLCRRLLGDTHAAQDVAQEALLQSYLSLADLLEPARYGAWLHGIAANMARMVLRRRSIGSLDLAGPEAQFSLLWPSGAQPPEQVVLAREVHDTIVAALNDLSPSNRDVAIGFFFDGYSYAELADLLNLPLSTVKGRLFKTRRQLQRSLAPLALEVLMPDSRRRKELPMQPPDLIEVKVHAIRYVATTDSRVIVLRELEYAPELNGWRYLPIWIGPDVADAIAVVLEGKSTPRPLTHDLSLRMLEPFGIQVRRVVINKILSETFYAEIDLEQAGQTQQVDARPSDAIALAIRTNVPIFVSRAVMEQIGLILSEEPAEGPQVIISALGLTPGMLAASAPVVDPIPVRTPLLGQLWSLVRQVLDHHLQLPPEERLVFSWRDHLALEATSASHQRAKLPGLEQDAWVVFSPEAWTVFEPFVDQASMAIKESARLTLEHGMGGTQESTGNP